MGSSDIAEFKREDLERSVPDRFESQVRRGPGLLAVKSGSQAFTYGALNQAANRLAHTILEQRGQASEPVAILLGHDAWQTAAMLGILKAGKAYVPLDPTFPRRRLAFMLEDSQAPIIITDSHNLALAEELAQEGHRVISTHQLAEGGAVDNPELKLLPRTLANILYTSGTTGRPKGVMMNHRNLLHTIMTITRSYGITADDRLAQVFSTSFAAATTPTFGALLNGATLLPFHIKRDLVRLADWLLQERVTALMCVVTLFRHLCATLTGDQQLPHLRLITIGGETVLLRDVDLYQKHFSDQCKLFVRLAGTETLLIRSYPLDKDTQITGNIVPVGHAVDDKHVLLLDKQGNEVGFDRVGEIAVRSRYLSPGYWQRPDLTGAAFLPAPEDGEERTYRTGDLGRMRPDGCLEHLGRIDFQVKIRGHRVELGEVEAALLDHPAVREAAVVARETQAGTKLLVAYVVPSGEPPPSVKSLRSALAGKLPDFMIPSSFVTLAALPLTATGKVDRRALPEYETGKSESDETFVASSDEVQTKLARLWEEVLGVRPVGARDDFFELGGNSLLAARLFAEIGVVFGKNPPLATLLQAPTIEQLAGVLRRQGEAAPWSSLVTMQPGDPARLPLFLVHGAGGGILDYAALVRCLGSDQPVYGLQGRGLNDVQQPDTCIEGMAAYAIEGLLTARPEGPYLLAGYCLGGLVAFEMARQLQANGRPVGLLAIVDVPPPNSGYHVDAWRPRSILSFLHNLPSWLLAAFDPGSAPWYSRARDRLAWLIARMRRARPGASDAKKAPVDLRLVFNDVEGMSDNERHRLETHAQALRDYVPRVFPGSITVMRARTQPLRWSFNPDPEMGWGKLAGGGVETRTIPGFHPRVHLQPHVQVLAKELRACLDSVQVAAPSN